VAAVAALTTNPLPAMDPLELRDRAFAGLRDLLTRLATRYTVVISIDDAQWADADSIALLAEVLRPPEAPSLLFLATVRTTSGPAPASNQSFQGDVVTRELHSAIPGDVRVMRLERLSHEQACELARSILGAEEPVSAAWVAEEADGHPLFIDALARYSRLHAGTGARVAVRLDEAISAPIFLLQHRERRILELLAISSGPVAQDVLASAAELSPELFARGMSVLRAGHLVMTSGSRGSDTVELYHDRIRVAVKQSVRRERRPELHRQLATALESSGSGDAQALASHWYGANESGQAARYAKMAADHATHALAFDRAATLYDRALRLEQGTKEERGELYERLGNAHASVGLGARAAHAFRKAARHANAARALDLRRRAAEQLLRAGHIDEGLEAMRGVLSAIGMRLPQTRLATLVSFFFWLLVVRARGLSFRRRDTSEIAAHELTRIDTCWSVALGLSITDTVRGAVFHNRALVLSLRAGEIYRVARALSLHAGFIATSGGRRGWGRALRMLERARALADESNDAHAIGWAAGAACVAHYTTGHFKEALGHFEAAERIWRESPGTAWEIDTIKVFAINSLAQLGSLAELCARAPKYLRETMERGDLYGAVNLRIGYANLHWLVLDRPADARREIDEAMEQWSKQGTHLEHFYELLARTNLALYEGRTAEGLDLMTRRWVQLDRALLFRVQSIRILARFMRARLEVAEGIARPGKAGERLLAAAARDARAIARERMDWGRPLADLIFAACTLAKSGRRQAGGNRHSSAEAIHSLRAAVSGFEASDMTLHAVVARAALGALLGGDEGARMTEEASSWMGREGVVLPAKMASMLAPGLMPAPVDAGSRVDAG
jgi:tetratricopeptide (TPR) repeat protein